MYDAITSKERMSSFSKRNYAMESLGSLIIIGFVFLSLIQITNIQG